MDTIMFDNMCTLEKIAEADEIYNVWHNSREAFSAQFESYVLQQPEEIRSILWGYAYSGEMMWQRKINLACTHMMFVE